MRILFYSPDSYGLGHVRRTIAIAERLIRDVPNPSALVLTGAPRAHYFRYPPHCDYVKLPSITKGSDGSYISRDIDLPLGETVRFRGRLIQEAADSFRPDLFLVDHSPRGLCGEVLPALNSLGRQRPAALRVLGLRDVIDEPEAVKAAWGRDGLVEVLRRCYDLVLVYGQREIFDPVAAYDIPSDVSEKLVFAGYIGRNGTHADPAKTRARYAPRTGRLVVVTAGGGGDGNLLIRSFLEGYEQLGQFPPFEALLVTGPLMSPRKRKRFRLWSKRLPGVTLLEYSDDMPGLYRAADFVVSMGGYNTVCELACAGARALLVPRIFPRREQLVRARRLAERGVVRYLLPEEAVPAALVREVLIGLESSRPPRRWGLDFSGRDHTARTLVRLVNLPCGGTIEAREPLKSAPR